MTIGPGGLLLFLLGPLVLGAAALAALGVRLRDDRLGWLGLCHVAGALLLALLLGTATRFGLPLTLPAVLALLGGAALLLALPALLRLRTAEPRADDPAPPGTAAGRLLFGAAVALSLVLLVDRALVSAGSPIHFGDEATIWNAKAKSLWFAGGITDRLGFYASSVLSVFQPDYPMLLPWNIVWVDLCAGAPTDVEARWPAQLALVALLLVAAGAIRRRAPPALSALLVLALGTSRALDRQVLETFADGLVALGTLVLVDAWMRFEATGGSRFARLAVVGAAFAAAAKNEGLLVMACFAAALGIGAALDRGLRARLRRLAASAAVLLLPAAVVALQHADNARFGWSNDLTGSGTEFWRFVSSQASLESLATIARSYGATSLSTINRAEVPFWADRADQNLIPAALLVLALLSIRARWPSVPGRRVAALAMVLWFAALVPIYLSSRVSVDWQLLHSTDRVCFQMVPAAAVLLASLLAGALGARPVSAPGPRGPAGARAAAAPASPGAAAG